MCGGLAAGDSKPQPTRSHAVQLREASELCHWGSRTVTSDLGMSKAQNVACLPRTHPGGAFPKGAAPSFAMDPEERGRPNGMLLASSHSCTAQ